jgi:hypothetical protein
MTPYWALRPYGLWLGMHDNVTQLDFKDSAPFPHYDCITPTDVGLYSNYDSEFPLLSVYDREISAIEGPKICRDWVR